MYRVQKKRKGFLFFIALFLCAFAIGLGIGYGVIKMNTQRIVQVPEEEPMTQRQLTTDETSPPDVAVALTTTVPAAEPTPGLQSYFVAETAGDVCVFTVDENGEKRFSHKLPIILNDLRPEDKRLFEEGFYLENKQALLEMTEDFSS